MLRFIFTFDKLSDNSATEQNSMFTEIIYTKYWRILKKKKKILKNIDKILRSIEEYWENIDKILTECWENIEEILKNIDKISCFFLTESRNIDQFYHPGLLGARVIHGSHFYYDKSAYLGVRGFLKILTT